MIIRKSQIVFFTCLSFIGGVAMSSFFVLPWLLIYEVAMIGVCLVILSTKRTILRTIGWCLLFFVIGIGRYQLSIPIINENHVAYYNNAAEAKFFERQSIIFQGIVNDEPDARKDQVKLKVKSRELKADDSRRRLHGNVLVKAPLYPQYQYGDVLEISCALSKPEPIDDFQYDKYLAKSNIYSTCYQPKIKLLESNRGDLLISAILKIKAKVVKTVGQILPEPQASFLGGLLWGAKKGMPEKILENFKRTGVTHIVAVSGYNITIIAVMLTNLFINWGLARQKAFWLIVLCLMFFILITGAPASIVRAGIMGLIVLITQNLGRVARMENTLAIVGLLMLLINPKVLIWDAGFQLSFLATMGLIYLSPLLKKLTKCLPNFLSVRESLTTTLSAMAFTTPLILFQFGRFSLIAPVANLLILPVIPINMAVGFLAVIVGLIWLPLGQLAGYFSWVLLTYILKVTEILGSLSWSSIIT
jgi:competence protein ComEC